MEDHEFVPGPPPADVKPCPCDEDTCMDDLAWCQVCEAGADAYQHHFDKPLYVEDILAGDLGDSSDESK